MCAHFIHLQNDIKTSRLVSDKLKFDEKVKVELMKDLKVLAEEKII